MKDIITLIALTFFPTFELRAAIPYGVLGTDMPLWSVITIVILANILLAPIVYLFLHKVMHLFLKINFINKIWEKIVVRTRSRVESKVKKYGVLGLAVFIGVPLPGSGVYSGVLGAYLLGMKFKDTFVASVIGVIIAASIITILTLLGEGLL